MLKPTKFTWLAWIHNLNVQFWHNFNLKRPIQYSKPWLEQPTKSLIRVIGCVIYGFNNKLTIFRCSSHGLENWTKSLFKTGFKPVFACVQVRDGKDEKGWNLSGVSIDLLYLDWSKCLYLMMINFTDSTVLNISKKKLDKWATFIILNHTITYSH